MPRRGENIYKRRDGRWEGRILKPDGKYLYFYSKSYKEVKEKMKKNTKKSTEDKPDKNINQSVTAQMLFQTWLEEYVVQKVKPTTYESYYHCFHKYVLPYFQQPGNEYITKDSIQGFVQMLQEDSSIVQTSKARVLSIFKSALKQILQNSQESYFLVELVKFPKVYYKEVQVFAMNEQRLIEYEVLCSKDQRLLGIILCFYTGIRLGELCALKWSDIDMDTGILSVNKTVSRIKTFQEEGNKTRLLVGTPKSRKSFRKIPLPSFLLNMAMESRNRTTSEDNYVLTGKDVPIDPRVYQKLFKRILQDAGVKERKFHAIRHTFATRALELGVDIKTLSELLGHSSVGITLNIYAHSLMDQKKIAIDKFNDMHLTNMNGALIAVTKSVKVVSS
ncbi:tyrosine-type recombinase/integrase [Anaerocolumna jejuensis]|uniref:tyrosine-type recombinase/integrase n=1 Tax=Anaerocolumna jejuensis TaxID=259063 RepID=UPI003F7C6705